MRPIANSLSQSFAKDVNLVNPSLKGYTNSIAFNKSDQNKHQHSKFDKHEVREPKKANLSNKIVYKCRICFSEYEPKQFIALTNCEHKLCKNCALQSVRRSLRFQKMYECLEGCQAQFNIKSGLIQMLTQKQCEMLRKAFFIYLTDKQGLIRCPNEDCSLGVLKPDERSQDIGECIRCCKRYCTKCLWPLHYCPARDHSFKKLILTDCLRCIRKEQRDQGQNKMKCNCKYQFCCLCLTWDYNSHTCSNNLIIQTRKLLIQILEERQLNQQIETLRNQQRQQIKYLRKLIQKQEAKFKQIQLDKQRIKRQPKMQQFKHQRRLQITKRFNQKKNGTWRQDDQQLHKLLNNVKTSSHQNMSDQNRKLQNTQLNLQNSLQNTQNQRQRTRNQSQKIERDHRRKSENIFSHNGNGQDFLDKKLRNSATAQIQQDFKRLQQFEKDKQKNYEARLQKMQLKTFQQNSIRFEQHGQQLISNKKTRSIKLNKIFQPTNNIF